MAPGEPTPSSHSSLGPGPAPALSLGPGAAPGEPFLSLRSQGQNETAKKTKSPTILLPGNLTTYSLLLCPFASVRWLWSRL